MGTDINNSSTSKNKQFMNFKTNKNAQIGLMVLFSLISFIWGYNFLKGRNILNPSNEYYLTYSEIAGLMESDPVIIRGLKIGQVNGIRFDPAKPENIVIRIVIDKNIKIPTDSKAILGSSGLIGTKNIKLAIGRAKTYYSAGDTLKGNTEVDLLHKLNAEINPIKDQGALFLSRADSIALSVNKILVSETINDLNATIKNLRNLTQEVTLLVAANRAGLTATINNLNLMSETVSNERENIAAMLQNLRSFSDTLNTLNITPTMEKLGSTMSNLDQLTAKLNNDEGSLSLLMKDPSLYYNLSSASENANLLLENFRNHPNRYVHFSLFNKSNSTYFDQDGVRKKLSENEDLSYRIVVKKTENPVSIDKNTFINPFVISEFKYKGVYYYYTGEFKMYDNVLENLEMVKQTYPDASILVLKKGKPIPIEKILE